MRTWHVLLAVIVLSVFFLYRSFVLESRVDLLYKAVQRSSGAAGSGASATDKRLRDLEAKVAMLNSRFNDGAKAEPSLDRNTLTNLDKLLASKHFDERVLSILDAEKQKAIDTQLKWHRDALVKFRMDSLNFFAADQKLSSGQLSALRSILEDEVDKMVEILRSPELLADHEKGLAAWAEMLRQTDKDAAEVLNEQQAKVYRHLRRLEQQALMPWLPEKDRS